EVLDLAARWQEEEAREVLGRVGDGLPVRQGVPPIKSAGAFERHLGQPLENRGHPVLELPGVYEQLRARDNAGGWLVEGRLAEVAHAAGDQGPVRAVAGGRELVDIDVHRKKVYRHGVRHAVDLA